MKPALDYLALAIALLPLSGVIAVLLCHFTPRLRRWWQRRHNRRLGSRYRDESWLSQGRTSTTQHRL